MCPQLLDLSTFSYFISVNRKPISYTLVFHPHIYVSQNSLFPSVFSSEVSYEF